MKREGFGDVSAPAPVLQVSPEVSFDTLAALRGALETLKDCALRQTATQMVFGEGPLNPDIMVIGEAPGNEEDQSGRPFVGDAGKMFNQMLAAAGYPREHCYITNIIPWRPPGNRAPTPHEVAQMLPFLRAHIRLVAPKSLVLLGGVVAKAVLKSDTGIMRLRGKIYPLEGTNILAVPTFHPAYLLGSPLQKQQAWEDLLRLKERLGGGGDRGV
jgi:DNA polymerase